MSANMVAVLYLLSALLFIFALRGLSHPESSSRPQPQTNTEPQCNHA